MSYSLLTGTRIVEGSAFIAAPLCGMVMAQLGADVIRFDAIGGGIDYRRMPNVPAGRSIYWTSLNKGKRSIAVDLKSEEGREIVRALIAGPGEGAGVFLTNVSARWLTHEVLARRRPDLISMRIEGNADGSTAVDYTVNSSTGLPFITGPASPDAPVNSILPAWDVTCAMTAAISLFAALTRRTQTGAGSEMKLALSDVAFTTLSHLGYTTEVEILSAQRSAIGNDIFGAFGRDFATAEGRRVMIAAISARQWRSLVEACAIGPAIEAIETAISLDFREERDRFEGRDLIAGLVGRWCRARSLTDIAGPFDAHGVCWGVYQTTTELVRADPRYSANNPVFQRIETDGVGSHLAAGFPARVLDLERQIIRPAPTIGQNTSEILADVLGLPDGEIGRLHDAGIVAGVA